MVLLVLRLQKKQAEEKNIALASTRAKSSCQRNGRIQNTFKWSSKFYVNVLRSFASTNSKDFLGHWCNDHINSLKLLMKVWHDLSDTRQHSRPIDYYSLTLITGKNDYSGPWLIEKLFSYKGSSNSIYSFTNLVRANQTKHLPKCETFTTIRLDSIFVSTTSLSKAFRRAKTNFSPFKFFSGCTDTNQIKTADFLIKITGRKLKLN